VAACCNSSSSSLLVTRHPVEGTEPTVRFGKAGRAVRPQQQWQIRRIEVTRADIGYFMSFENPFTPLRAN
jgi:hypothetical protein